MNNLFKGKTTLETKNIIENLLQMNIYKGKNQFESNGHNRTHIMSVLAPYLMASLVTIF